MKRIIGQILFAVAGLSLVAGGADAASMRSVTPAQQRAAVLKRAADMLAPKTPKLQTTEMELPDPFFRSSSTKTSKETTQEAAPAAVADMGTLERVAAQIQPTGTLLIGSEPYLLIGGRRYKVGDVITITFEGLVYQVAISSIERNQYTLRLNDNELRREFK